MKWAIVIEKSSTGYGGYAPDLPGLGVVGETREEVRRLLREGIELYLEETADEAPKAPESEVDYLELSA